MCLDVVWDKEKQKKWLKKHKGPLHLWKTVKDKENRFMACCEYFTFKNGLNVSKTPDHSEEYIPYFHLFTSQKAAGWWRWYDDDRIVQCRVFKKDVTAIGEQTIYDNSIDINSSHLATVVVARRIFMPEYPQKRIRKCG